MLKDLTKWMAEALKQERATSEDNRQTMERLVQGIPEWCAQAASSAAADADGQNGDDHGIGSSGAPPAVPEQQQSCNAAGRKRKAPPSKAE